MSELQNPLVSPSLAGEKEALNALLAQGFPSMLRLPEPLEQDFRQHYRQSSARLLRGTVFALIALYFMVVWPISLFIQSPYLPLWQNYAVVPIGAVLVVLWLSTRLEAMARYIDLMLAVSLFTCLCGTLYCAVRLGSQYLGQVAAYETIYVMMIAFSVLRMPTRLATLATLAAFLVVVAAVSSHGRVPLWPDVFLYAGAPLLICVVGGGLLEYAERRSFVQTRLLDVQSRQLEGLNRLARLDALSGLANRRHLDETLKREWERARRDGHSLATVFLDIDYFKRYNDNYGHSAGDQCLSVIGRILGRALHRPADLAARYGGEEFMLLLPNTDEVGALLVAERIMEQIDALDLPHLHSPIARQVTVSIGVAACIPARDQDAQTLVDAADEALYRSKSSGRNRITVGQCAVEGPVRVAFGLPTLMHNELVQA